MPLTPDEITSIVDHMNQDHADTIVNYVRYYGGVDGVISASLHSINQNEIYIDVVAHSLSCRLAIPLIRPLTSVTDARIILVEMAKQARSGLHDEAEQK
ncbi:heme iron utilization protein [Hahella sp. CCB-MM4]|uniref:DUF2470 domain-containing protein n=1 Tax=Hahella sp. (strain CCB-MM4) TaxID=1926491 RepID=UPI000B9BF8F4|nr:DUF2470 domain-containing protein [Hahella sp. CCB-MM4]OZG74618.1 heme iron utilization protein [Hahella sp. CCB-MM4]